MALAPLGKLLFSLLALGATCPEKFSLVDLERRVANLPTENLGGFLKGHTLKRVQPNAIGFLPAQAIGGENDFFVGFLKGHPYIVAGKKRFDGNMFFKPSKTQAAPMLSEGIVVRIRDPELRKNVEAFLETQQPLKKLNCVAGACTVLSEGGKTAKKIDFLTPHNLLRHLVTKPVKNPEGQSAGVEIFMVGSGSAESQIQVMKSVSRKEAAGMAQMVAGTLVVVGGVGYGANLLTK